MTFNLSPAWSGARPLLARKTDPNGPRLHYDVLARSVAARPVLDAHRASSRGGPEAPARIVGDLDGDGAPVLADRHDHRDSHVPVDSIGHIASVRDTVIGSRRAR